MLRSNAINLTEKRTSRRLYLFALTTLCLGLSLYLVTTDHRFRRQNLGYLKIDAPSSSETGIPGKADRTDSDGGRSLLLAGLKEQITAKNLSSLLQKISQVQNIQSRLLKGDDIEQVRKKLMDGGLVVENDQHDSTGGWRTYRISLMGGGTPDEALFLQLLAENIQKSTTPMADSRESPTN